MSIYPPPLSRNKRSQFLSTIIVYNVLTAWKDFKTCFFYGSLNKVLLHSQFVFFITRWNCFCSSNPSSEFRFMELMICYNVKKILKKPVTKIISFIQFTEASLLLVYFQFKFFQNNRSKRNLIWIYIYCIINFIRCRRVIVRNKSCIL